jgi:hypothetical protein
MKYMKMLGLAAVAAMALMAFAGTASATELYSGATTLKAGTVIDASLTGSAILETTGGTVLNTCTGGTVKGKTANNGGPAETVKGNIEELTWTGCTRETITTKPGALEIHHIAGTKDGTVIGSGSEVTINGLFGTSCVYGTGPGTHLGTLKGTTAGDATLAIKATVPLTIPNWLCPSTAVWNANYTVTQPTPLHVTAS